MALSKEQREELRQRLDSALIPPRAYSMPLKAHGVAGDSVRAFLAGSYGPQAAQHRGAIFYPYKPGLAASFARDITLSGASALFYYLQRFANRDTDEDGLPQAFVIEYFEQDGESPFTGAQRFRVETRISELIDDGVIFYLFTGVHPEHSKWWSKQFIEMLLENCSIEGVEIGNRTRGKRATKLDPQARGSKDTRRVGRVSIR